MRGFIVHRPEIKEIKCTGIIIQIIFSVVLIVQDCLLMHIAVQSCFAANSDLLMIMSSNLNVTFVNMAPFTELVSVSQTIFGSAFGIGKWLLACHQQITIFCSTSSNYFLILDTWCPFFLSFFLFPPSQMSIDSPRPLFSFSGKMKFHVKK